jgi:hypothetical protein
METKGEAPASSGGPCDCAAYERVVARYDELVETWPAYAGMWRARARILRREHEQLHASAAAIGGAT